MLEIIKSMLLDFQEASWYGGIPRRVKIESVSGKATVCIGVRRCGKSTYMFQIMRRLIDSGTPKENILYLNFFDDRLHGLQQYDFSIIIEAYFSLYPEKKNKEKIYCFFDEIQMVDGWELFIERLLRTELCEVYITGSSAQMLSKEIATQMRGRALSWEMFPFSFHEFLDSTSSVTVNGHLSTKQRLLVQNTFNDFWETGGFPEVIGLSQFLRIKTHQEYFHLLLFRDLIERHNVSHPKAVVDLAYKLIDNIGSLYSLNALDGYLHSLGHKVPKNVVANYLAWFEDAYFLFSVRLWDASLARSKVNPKKIYCIDHALIKSISSGILLNQGHLLENLVFIALRRVKPSIYYYKTDKGREVDFIVQLADRTRMLVQVCETLVNTETRQREITALSEAMGELKENKAWIITRQDKEEEISLAVGKIQVMPIWQFLLMTIPA